MKRKNAGFAGLGRNVFAESSQIRKDRQARHACCFVQGAGESGLALANRFSG